MASQYKVPGQNLTISIPDINEVFRSGNDVFKRTDTGIIGLNQKQYGNLGYDINSLNRYDNAGEIVQALGKIGQKVSFGMDAFTNDASLFSRGQTQQTSYTQSVNPDNPYGITVTDAQGNVVNKSVSLAQALANAGATPEQAASLVGSSLKNVGMGVGDQSAPFSAQQLAQAGVTPPPPKPIIPSTLSSGNLQVGNTPGYTTAQQTTPYPVATLETPAPPTLNPQEKTAQDLFTRLQSLNSSLEGRSAYQTSQNTAFGVDAAQKTINDLSAQLTALKNEAAAIPLQLAQGAGERGVTTGLLGAQENSRLRTNAIAALGVSTLLAAAQGQLANAQSLADKAVAQKYDPIEEQIKSATANLNLIINSPEYTKAEKAQAQAELENQNKKKAAVELAKDNANVVQQVAIKAASNMTNFKPTAQYSTVALALKAIQNATDPVVATQIASQTGLLGAQTPSSTSIVEAGGRKKLINDLTGETIKDLGVSSSGTPSPLGGTTSNPVDTSGEVREYLLKQKQNNPNTPYYDLWGQLAEKLKQEGLNPGNYDKVFWEVLHPEGLAGYDKYVNSGLVNPF